MGGGGSKLKCDIDVGREAGNRNRKWKARGEAGRESRKRKKEVES